MVEFYYDVFDIKENKMIMQQKKVGEIAKALGVNAKNVSQVIHNAKECKGTGLINKRFKIICDIKHDFKFKDKNGEKKVLAKNGTRRCIYTRKPRLEQK